MAWKLYPIGPSNCDKIQNFWSLIMALGDNWLSVYAGGVCILYMWPNLIKLVVRHQKWIFRVFDIENAGIISEAVKWRKNFFLIDL